MDNFSAYYDKINVRAPIIPYEDLEAMGGYDHTIQIPQNVFPTIATLSAQGPDHAKLLRTDADGKLLVASAGGGTSTVPRISGLKSGFFEDQADNATIDVTGITAIVSLSL